MEKLMREGKWNPKEGFFCMLANELLMKIFQHLDPVSLFRMTSLSERFSLSVNPNSVKILDLRPHPDLMSPVVHFVCKQNIKINELLLANGEYSDDDVKCIEILIKTNAERLTKLIFPPLAERLLRGELISAALECKNLEELDVSAHPDYEINYEMSSLWPSGDELSDHLLSIVNNNRSLSSIKIHHWGCRGIRVSKIAMAVSLGGHRIRLIFTGTCPFMQRGVLRRQNEMLLEIFGYLDLVSLYRMTSFTERISILIQPTSEKILDLRCHQDLMSKVVRFILTSNIKINGLLLANGDYSDRDIECIEVLIAMNKDRLKTLILPPLTERLLKGELISAALKCTNLEELDVSGDFIAGGHNVRSGGGAKLTNLLYTIIKNNKNLESITLNGEKWSPIRVSSTVSIASRSLGRALYGNGNGSTPFARI